MKIPILAYHKIDTALEWGINTVSPRAFEKQIRFLHERGFQSVKIEDIIFGDVQAAKPVVITFDDAYRSVYEHAFPVLARYGFTATVFVVSEYIGKCNSWDVNLGGRTCMHLDFQQLRELIAAGWEIGSHTATHADLIGLSPEKQLTELRSSKIDLENRLSAPVRIISYPYNRYNSVVIGQAIAAGYDGGCCLAPDNSIAPHLKIYAIPRMGVYAIDSLLWFKLKLEHPLCTRLDNIRQKAISFFANGSVYYHRMKKIKKSIAI
ncbi:polysaccharide deacetylase family protein [candidate division KSB1 bacterium]|nr:polysaccharide deacetylase family protein [candidate division KSB1 bacterium]